MHSWTKKKKISKQIKQTNPNPTSFTFPGQSISVCHAEMSQILTYYRWDEVALV